MSKNEEQFARLIGGLDVNAELNPQHREQLRKQMLSAFGDAVRENATLRSTWPSHRGIGNTEGTVISIWRTLMSSRLSKSAAVAAVAAVVILGLTFIEGKNKKAGKAWAIEQTIQALQDVRNVYFKGSVALTHKQNPIIADGEIVPAIMEAWAISHNGLTGDEGRVDLYLQGEIKFRSGDNVDTLGPSTDETASISVKRTDAVYHYNLFSVSGHYIQINTPDTFLVMDPWPGPQYFQQLKEKASKWEEEYGNDEVTGRDSVFVRCAGEERSNWIQFDLESKLPVRVKQWENANWEGEPYGDYEQIVYNLDIPDDTFNVTIEAESLHVVDQRKATPDSERTFTIEIPDGTCKFPEIVEDALKERAKQESTTKSE